MENTYKGIGVIDALTAGFELMIRRPWAVLIPIALNLFILFGPILSVGPLAHQVANGIASAPALPSADYAQVLASASQLVSQWGDQSNLFGLLVVGLLGVPSSVGVGAAGAAIPVVSWPAAIGLAVLLLGAGVYVAAFYLGVISAQVRGESAVLPALLAQAGRYAWRLVVLGCVLLGLFAALAVPVFAALGVLALVSLQAASAAVTLAVWGGLIFGIWVFFYLFFVTDAIVLDNATVRQAVSRSLAVVRRNPGASLVLILLTVVISAGIGIVWDAIGGNIVGTLAGVVGNAYIGSGLVAASLVFYGSRWRVIKQELVVANGRALQKTGEQNDMDRPGE